jgi:hypothetical protein
MCDSCHLTPFTEITMPGETIPAGHPLWQAWLAPASTLVVMEMALWLWHRGVRP